MLIPGKISVGIRRPEKTPNRHTNIYLGRTCSGRQRRSKQTLAMQPGRGRLWRRGCRRDRRRRSGEERQPEMNDGKRQHNDREAGMVDV